MKEMYGTSCLELCNYYLYTATVYHEISSVYATQNNSNEKVKNINKSLCYFEQYYKITMLLYDKSTEEYAKALHVEAKLRSYLEVLL